MNVQDMKDAMAKLEAMAQRYSNEILRLQGEYRLLNDLVKIEESKEVVPAVEEEVIVGDAPVEVDISEGGESAE